MNNQPFALRSEALVVALAISLSACSEEHTDAHLESVPQRLDSSDWADDRAAALVEQMSLEEKIAQLQNTAPPIERLGIPPYQYWNEALHGVLTSAATSFPSPIALGASWDPDLIHRVATAISDEARAIRLRDGKGLTYWSPVINLLRDPRWGRYDESFTEDPFLMSQLGVAFTRGLQGDDPKYLKTVATPKHFALNSSEYNRHTGSSDADQRLLYEYYLPPFRAAVVEGGAFSVMASYNRVNGVPSSANSWLLEDTLRTSWGFEGYVVSDCGAVNDIVNGHHWTATLAEASASALLAGTDLNCGASYANSLGSAVEQGLVTEANLDRALTRVMRARFLLGEFDPVEDVPYNSISTDVIESVEHRDLALQAAKASIVLLKNEANLLPLDAEELTSIAVIGPHTNTAVLGSYSGNPSQRISALTALTQKLSGTEITITSAAGTSMTGPGDPTTIDAAAAVARDADVALMFLGTDLTVFREERDRPDWALPGAQQELLEAVYAANPRTVVVLVTGGPLGIDWANANVPAILTTFYNGQEQGTAIADVLFGDHNPGGKLSTTWYRLDAALPPPGEYDIRQGFTYLYHQETPLYPFGHGLSYTEFAYGALTVSPRSIGLGERVTATIPITNRGDRGGDEIVQLYVRALDSTVERPLQQLRGFTRLSLEPGETQTATFTIGPEDVSYWDESESAYRVERGRYLVKVGASSTKIHATGIFSVSETGLVGTGGGGGAGGSPADTVRGDDGGAGHAGGGGDFSENGGASTATGGTLATGGAAPTAGPPTTGGLLGGGGTPEGALAAAGSGSPDAGSPSAFRPVSTEDSESGCSCRAPTANQQRGSRLGLLLALILVVTRRRWRARSDD
jgi:beta-glucosidase